MHVWLLLQHCGHSGPTGTFGDSVPIPPTIPRPQVADVQRRGRVRVAAVCERGHLLGVVREPVRAVRQLCVPLCSRLRGAAVRRRHRRVRKPALQPRGDVCAVLQRAILTPCLESRPRRSTRGALGSGFHVFMVLCAERLYQKVSVFPAEHQQLEGVVTVDPALGSSSGGMVTRQRSRLDPRPRRSCVCARRPGAARFAMSARITPRGGTPFDPPSSTRMLNTLASSC